MTARSLAMGLIAATTLVACTKTPVHPVTPKHSGDSSYTALPAEDARRYALQEGDSVQQPVAVENPAPVYPEDLLAANLPPVELDVRVAVTPSGTIDDCFLLTRQDAAPHLAEFFTAVRAATSGWRFSPLLVRHMEDVDENGDGEPDSVRQGEALALPFSLDYRFRFSIKAGRPQVEQASAGH